VGEAPFLGGPQGSKPHFLFFLGLGMVRPSWVLTCPHENLWRFILGRGCRLRILFL
ncbi:hypothetical protein A2U01_0101050, partial [Trifolium medium]|nr:hypothetical protein [Trifolium medium]